MADNKTTIFPEVTFKPPVNLLPEPTDWWEELIYKSVEIIISNILVGCVSLVGLVTNTVTSVVLGSQVKDGINILFLALTISDLCCVITGLWYSAACTINKMNPPNFQYDTISFLVVTAIQPRIAVVRSTCWLTALLGVVRCLSVVSPFKFNAWLTRQRMTAMTLTVSSVAAFVYLFDTFHKDGFGIVHIPYLNITKIVIVEKSDGKILDDFDYVITCIFLPVVNFLIIFVCTVVMIIKVKTSSNWRMKAQAGDTSFKNVNSNSQYLVDKGGKSIKIRDSSTKETKLSKMVITITSIFIVCNIPDNVILIVRYFVPGFTERGVYKNLFTITHGVIYLLETCYSSIGLLVFYKMSTKFRSRLDTIFKWSTP